jgi:hypothetical protein
MTCPAKVHAAICREPGRWTTVEELPDDVLSIAEQLALDACLATDGPLGSAEAQYVFQPDQ